MNLNEFLDKSSHFKCFICQRNILDDKINYCKNCKIVLDGSCINYHQNLCHDIKLNQNIFNYCLEHGNQLIFRCMECNQSLCNNCDLVYHNDKKHRLEQLTKFSFNINELMKIKDIFDKQKKIFEKIKNIFYTLIK